MKKWTIFSLLLFCLSTVAPAWSAPATPAAATAVKININKASATELQSLPGIGAVTAAEIVTYRAKHGNFRSADDLMAVKGVGNKTLEKVRNMITTDDSR